MRIIEKAVFILQRVPLTCCCLLDFPLPPFRGALAESVVFGLAIVLFRPETLVGTLVAAFFLLLPVVAVEATRSQRKENDKANGV